jgi:hypothetical protein
MTRRTRRMPKLGAAILPLAILLFDRTAGSASPSGYYLLTTGTALDTRTGVRWQRGWAVPNASDHYAEALAACQALNLEGMTGWRLPTVRELETVYDVRHGGSGRPYDENVFQAAQSLGSAVIWSSTPLPDDATKIQGRGQFTRAYQTSSYSALDKVNDFGGVRCVRQ